MIDALLKNSSSPPIIIIQGDHGPGPSFRSPSIDKLCLKEKASILNAYYLPGLPSNSLYETISPVNTFRIFLTNTSRWIFDYWKTRFISPPIESIINLSILPRSLEFRARCHDLGGLAIQADLIVILWIVVFVHILWTWILSIRRGLAGTPKCRLSNLQVPG